MSGEPAVARRSGTARRSKGWKLALRLFVSAAFLAVLVTRVPGLRKSIPKGDPLHTALLLGAAVVVVFIGIVLSAWRWQQVLVLFDAPASLRTLSGHYFAGQFVGNVLPSTIGGDVLRVSRCSNTVGSTTVAFASVVLERLSGMLALPLLVVVGFALEPSLFDVEHTWVALLVAAITLTALALILFAAGHPGLGGRYSKNANWTRFIGAVFQGVDRARREPRQMLYVLAIAVIYQLSIIVSYLLIFHALRNSVSIPSAIAFIPAVSMLQVLPISFNGLGVRESALVLFRFGLGVSAAVAGTAGLLWYGSLVIVSMFGAPVLAVGQRTPHTEPAPESAVGHA
jgi:glycosyltransferase 2 family protein